MKRNKLRS